jgi:beta-lactamase superfamily II metal-dependent hydrolase
MLARLAAVLALCGGLAAAAAPRQDEPRPLRIHWIDVEGGAATLVVTPGGEGILMDCGWPGERDAARIEKAVKAAGLEEISHYVTSHYHVDHWGGFEELDKRVHIRRMFFHEMPGPEAKDVDAKLKDVFVKGAAGRGMVIRAGDPIQAAGVKIRVLSANGLVEGEEPGAPQVRPCTANPAHPAKPADTSDNARSIGYLLEWKGFRFLNLGDLTWNVEHKLVCPENRIGKVDVYQTTHHGLDQSNHPALLAAVEPVVAVMNNGAKKGGQASVVKLLRSQASLKDLYQVHLNVQSGKGDNAAPEFVANDGEKCEGHGITLTVAPDGKSYAVEVPSKKTRKTYETRAK